MKKYVEYIKKDITTVQSGIVAHGCNTKGLFGAGVALGIKHTWPKAYSEYAMVCRQSKIPSDLLGTVNLVDVSDQPATGKKKAPGTLLIANCFTQLQCGRNGVYASVDAIKEALSGVFAVASLYDIPLYLPKIGAGLGGLSWSNDVEPIVEQLSREAPEVQVFVCEL
jgi:O-acetyl-ADP-ribose deacetylase (regulator of RNase III)